MIRRRIFEPEHEMFRDTVRKWAEAEVYPRSAEFRRAGMVARDVWASAGRQGFLAMYADPAYGGLGLDDFRFDMVLIEELAARENGLYIPLHNRIVGPYLHRFGSDAQKREHLPGVVSGDTVLAIAMTEPDIGSDLAGMRTRAEDRGDHWLLNGSKTYISNGILAGLVIVAARTGTGRHDIGLFLVPEGTAGFTRGRRLEKIGLHSQDTAELHFENVKLPKSAVLGEPAGGFRMMMQNLAEERLVGSNQFIAHAQRAFDITLDYILERKAFGQTIGSFQNSRFQMAALKTKIDAGWAFVDHCAREHLEGALTADLAAQAKLLCSEIEGEVVDACLQLHGGAGFMEEYEIGRMYCSARVSRIYAGTSEIMKEIIGRKLGLGDRG
ncbi:acyl-CoA dehydrogenase family protein [Pseudosulfitobacter pseudonitzschiae]|uniref:acyl-CoA dehydrogenase family protein n=1 Tax=Pseudosulfitobacter pseudonitzschiae TaxID=1402135 RepID=UPI001CCD541B|nr:acyl-CoA dehydrogenase family protein [Pseudosulfitobacter pseudonitzschiae]MCA0137165.1 acyl-CoA dehydrogenase family protein [Pseudosulfitobacter pseudonitzschiae]MCD2328937.1 acyl-CoA dehydrogenase family protein [Pseudosulfitobacter pseudonitzschiae]MCD2353177.1 acyl-CoA dehydrogenase family protein [Pseudosulfitobacter pseudonitzschiae]